MAVVSDVRPYSVAFIADTDTDTPLGGAIDTSRTIEFLDSPGLVQLVSSDAGDTGPPNVLMIGLDAGDNIVQELHQPNGLTPVPFTTTFAQLLKMTASAAAIGDLTIENQVATDTGTASAGTANTITCPTAPAGLAGQIIRLTGGTDAGEIRLIIQQIGQELTVNRAWTTPPDGSTTYRVSPGFLLQNAPFSALQSRRLFYNAVADSVAVKIIYDKFFFRNDNGVDTIPTPIFSMTDPSGLIRFGLAAALNDVLTTTDRLTAPSGITFGTGPQPVSSLTPGDRIGVWVEITIPAAFVGLIDTQDIFSLAWTA
jgi:hypothetical protein